MDDEIHVVVDEGDDLLVLHDAEGGGVGRQEGLEAVGREIAVEDVLPGGKLADIKVEAVAQGRDLPAVRGADDLPFLRLHVGLDLHRVGLLAIGDDLVADMRPAPFLDLGTDGEGAIGGRQGRQEGGGAGGPVEEAGGDLPAPQEEGHEDVAAQRAIPVEDQVAFLARLQGEIAFLRELLLRIGDGLGREIARQGDRLLRDVLDRDMELALPDREGGGKSKEVT